MKPLFKFAALLLTAFVLSCSSSDSAPVDPCEGITCYNDGYCQDGTCICPEGFTGPDCQVEVTPSKITISKIVVTLFDNAAPDGDFWDSSVNGYSPDVFVGLFRIDGNHITQIYDADIYYPDALSPGHFQFPVNLSVDNVNQPHIIGLFNYNADDIPSGDPEPMGEIAFYPYEPNTGFPAVRTLNEGYFTAEVYLEYEW